MGKRILRSDGMSHANRRFEKKFQFYESVRNAVATKAINKEKLQRRRSRQKKLKAFDLSSLAEYLPDLTTPRKSERAAFDLSSLAEYLPDLTTPRKSEPAEFKLNCTTRNNLVLKESNRLMIVFNHPAFSLNPLGAIYQHLQSTQPAIDEKLKRKHKKAKRRSPIQLQSMEI